MLGVFVLLKHPHFLLNQTPYFIFLIGINCGARPTGYARSPHSPKKRGVRGRLLSCEPCWGAMAAHGATRGKEKRSESAKERSLCDSMCQWRSRRCADMVTSCWLLAARGKVNAWWRWLSEWWVSAPKVFRLSLAFVWIRVGPQVRGFCFPKTTPFFAKSNTLFYFF